MPQYHAYGKQSALHSSRPCRVLEWVIMLDMLHLPGLSVCLASLAYTFQHV